MLVINTLVACQEFISQAYQDAQSIYGNLDLSLDCYSNRLHMIFTKYLGEEPNPLLLNEFLNATHTTDLYLTTACAGKSEAAWLQFDQCFSSFLLDLAKRACANRADAEELSQAVMSELFLADRSGRPRIASYDGQCSLARWLRIVILHRQSNEQKLKWQSFTSLDEVTDAVMEPMVLQAENLWRASRYRPLVRHSFQDAARSLTEREKFILLLIYEQKVSAQEAAKILDVHPSRVSRQLQQIYQKLRRQVVTLLADIYHLSPEAVAECLQDAVENPEYSLLEMVKKAG